MPLTHLTGLDLLLDLMILKVFFSLNGSVKQETLDAFVSNE